MLPVDKIKRLFYVWHRKLLAAVGHDIFLENFERGIAYYVVYLLMLLFFTTSTYSIVISNWISLLKLSPIICVGCELTVKLYANRYRSEILENMLRLVDIYEKNSRNAEERRNEICVKFAFISEYIFIIIVFLYTCSGFIYIMYPTYEYVVNHRFEPILALMVPGIDHTKLSHYIFLCVFHVIITVSAVVGTIASDFPFVCMIVNVLLLSNIMKVNIKELNAMLRQKERNVTRIRAKFRNIIIIHQEITE